MTGKEVAKIIRSFELEPLEIRLRDGRSLVVERLETLGMTRDRKTLTRFVGPDEDKRLGLLESIDIDQIVEMKQAVGKTSAVGRRKKAS